jgi:hypothetical protein
MANVTLRLVKGTPLTNSEVDNNFSNLNITKTEIGGDLGGNVFYPSVIGLQGRSVSSTAPANAQVLSWSVSANAWVPGNAASSYSDLQTKPAVNVTITGDVTGGANVLLANTSTNSLAINVSYGYDNLDSRFLKLNNVTNQVVTGNINFQGNISFSGNVTTISANNLVITDNFIYLNDNSQNTNVDFGLVGNYNDGTYAHSGVFRDISDAGTWKFFEGYTPEPDAAVNINTDHASFRLANLAIQVLKANSITGITSNTVVTNLNADLLDGQQGTYYSDYTNQTNRPAANVIIGGIVLGTANASLGVNTNLINIQTTSNSSANVSYNNVVAGNAIIGGAVYGTSVYSAGSPVWTAANDGTGSGLDADLLDGQDGLYYTNYVNQSNKPAANIVLAGNLLGSANTILSANTNIITISAAVAANSVTLGTHTVGRFIANVEAGTAIVVSGGGAEDTVATVSHADTSTLAGLQGGAGVASITVDGLGHVTAVTSATYLEQPGLNLLFTGDVTGSANTYLVNSQTNFVSVGLTVAANSVALGTDTTGNYVDRVVPGTGISATGTADEGNVITVGLTTTGVSASTYGNSSIVPVITVDAQGRITSASNTIINYDGIGNKPAANIVLSGDATGTANAVLTANSTVLSLAATLASTGVVATTYGNSTIVPVITVDAKGRITSASNVALSAVGGSDYNTLTNKPAVNVTFTGDVTGSGNVLLSSGGTNSLSIALTVGPDSVALGTDTTGSYTARVVPGTGISATGTADEGNVITVGLTTTGVSATTYGNSSIVPVVTIDAQGRITSASNTVINYDGIGNRPAANIVLSGDVTGTANALLTANSTVLSLSATLASTGVVATTYGNATIVPVITVDAKGRITSASNVSLASIGGSDYSTLTNKPAANVSLTGFISGSSNVVLGSGTNLINITTVKANTEFYFSNTAPSPAVVGDTWVHSETGIHYKYIDDGNSSQWVDVTSYASITSSTSSAVETFSPFLLMGA